MPRHNLPPVALALVAAVLFAPAVAGAQGANLAAPAAPAAKPIPPAVIAKLIEHIAADGRDASLPPAIAAALGLGAGGEAWPSRQFAVQSQATGVVHAAAAGARPDSDLILSTRGDAAITIFRLRRDGALVGAVYFFPETQSVAPAPTGAAAHDFDDERVFWQRTIETLSADR